MPTIASESDRRLVGRPPPVRLVSPPTHHQRTAAQQPRKRPWRLPEPVTPEKPSPALQGQRGQPEPTQQQHGESPAAVEAQVPLLACVSQAEEHRGTSWEAALVIQTSAAETNSSNERTNRIHRLAPH